MKTGKMAYDVYRWALLGVSSSLVLFLLAFPEIGRSEEGPSTEAAELKNNAAQLKIADEEFAFVPGEALLIEDHYVLALYKNAEKGHYAIALLTANCGSNNCKIGDLVAYSVFDDQGNDVEAASASRPVNQTRFPPEFSRFWAESGR